MFAELTMFFDRTARPEIAAIFFGITTNLPGSILWTECAAVADHLRSVLAADTFDSCARAGAAMTLTEAVRYRGTFSPPAQPVGT